MLGDPRKIRVLVGMAWMPLAVGCADREWEPFARIRADFASRYAICAVRIVNPQQSQTIIKRVNHRLWRCDSRRLCLSVVQI